MSDERDDPTLVMTAVDPVPTGEIVVERVAANTLLWQRDGVLWRVEGFTRLSEALDFVAQLHRSFNPERQRLLLDRDRRHRRPPVASQRRPPG